MQNPENPFETVILHMGVNDFLKRDFNIDVVTNNIMNIANNVKLMELKTNSFQVLQSTTALHSDFINAVNNKGSKC